MKTVFIDLRARVRESTCPPVGGGGERLRQRERDKQSREPSVGLDWTPDPGIMT